MYKRAWQTNMIKALEKLDKFTLDLLEFIETPPHFSVQNPTNVNSLLAEVDKIIKNSKINESKKNLHYIIKRTKLKNHICTLKLEKYSLLNEYKVFQNQYFDIVSKNKIFKDDFSEGVNSAFVYLYNDLIDSDIFISNYSFKNKISIKKEIKRIIGGSQTCPYCDAIELDTNISSIDHFLPKHKFPLLSIYSKNLIVSCTGCNDRIKGKKIYLPICHPTVDDIENMFKFHLDLKNKIVNININSNLSFLDKRKVENFIKLFDLEDRYKHAGYEKVKKLFNDLTNCVIFHLENLKDFSPTISVDEIMVKKIVVKFIEKKKDDIKKTRLINSYSKLYLDFLEEISSEDSSIISITKYVLEEFQNYEK